MKPVEISLGSIAKDFNFSVRYGINRDLISSIKENGILQPVIAFKKGASYIVVSGKRRIEAAKRFKFKTVPAFIIKKESPHELLKKNINNDLSSSIPYTPVEKAIIFHKLCDLKFAIEEKQKIFHLLKIPFTQNSCSILKAIKRSNRSVKMWIHFKNMPFSLLSFLLEFSKTEAKQLVADIFTPFNTTASEAVSIATMMHDISIRDKVPLSLLIHRVLKNVPKRSTGKKTVKSIADALFKIRYPTYSRFLNDLKKTKKDLDLPHFLNISLSDKSSPGKIIFIADISSKKDAFDMFKWFESPKHKKKLLSLFKNRYFR